MAKYCDYTYNSVHTVIYCNIIATFGGGSIDACVVQSSYLGPAAAVFLILGLCIKLVHQDQDQDRLLVKRRNDNHSTGPVIREISP